MGTGEEPSGANAGQAPRVEGRVTAPAPGGRVASRRRPGRLVPAADRAALRPYTREHEPGPG